jgi:hypothetical protein
VRSGVVDEIAQVNGLPGRVTSEGNVRVNISVETIGVLELTVIV